MEGVPNEGRILALSSKGGVYRCRKAVTNKKVLQFRLDSYVLYEQPNGTCYKYKHGIALIFTLSDNSL